MYTLIWTRTRLKLKMAQYCSFSKDLWPLIDVIIMILLDYNLRRFDCSKDVQVSYMCTYVESSVTFPLIVPKIIAETELLQFEPLL